MANRDPRTNNDGNSLSIFLDEYFDLLLAGFIIIVLALAFFLIILPRYEATIAAVQTNVDQQKQLYNEQQKKLNGLKVIYELYSRLNPTDLKKFNGVLPNTFNSEDIYGELEEMVNDNGFVLDSVNVISDGKTVNASSTPVRQTDDEGNVISASTATVAPVSAFGPHVGEASLDVTVSSIDYNGFKALLKLFENNIRFFDVKKVSFFPDQATANFLISTYYYKQ